MTKKQDEFGERYARTIFEILSGLKEMERLLKEYNAAFYRCQETMADLNEVANRANNLVKKYLND